MVGQSPLEDGGRKGGGGGGGGEEGGGGGGMQSIWTGSWLWPLH